MTDDSSRFGTYDPFEDTGDWPFRDAPPREDDVHEDPYPAAQSEGAAPDPLAAESASVLEVPDEPEAEAEPELDADPDPAPGAEVEPDDPQVMDAAIDEAEPDVASEEDAPAGEVAVEIEEEEIEEVTDAPDVSLEHAPGDLVVPSGVDVLAGASHGFRRSVAVVVSRFNGDITTRMLEHSLDALRECHVTDDAITVVPVPGAFELPLAALALAKTRRFACVVALGCVIRGETPHFDVIAGEAASGLQLAAIETGIPVSFGVLTCDTREQADARVERGADAARAALEMADLFSHVRTRAAQQ